MTAPVEQDFVSVDERIATFDNDGTLWTEQPVYFQVAFPARSRQGAGAATSLQKRSGSRRFLSSVASSINEEWRKRSKAEPQPSQHAAGRYDARGDIGALGSAAPLQTVQAQRPTGAGRPRPNILVIFGDDIGQTNISAYSLRPDGLPHAEHRPHRQRGHDVHRLLRRAELHGGAVVVHHRACTLRTGLSKVGIPGATVGLQASDATIAELLKPLGYATGQFGKNHLGDRNEYLPTVTASTSSSATSTTSMPRRTPRTVSIRATRSSGRSSGRAACCAARLRS